MTQKIAEIETKDLTQNYHKEVLLQKEILTQKLLSLKII